MDSVDNDDSDEMNHSFNFFKVCGKKYLETKDACKMVDTDFVQEEIDAMIGNQEFEGDFLLTKKDEPKKRVKKCLNTHSEEIHVEPEHVLVMKQNSSQDVVQERRVSLAPKRSTRRVIENVEVVDLESVTLPRRSRRKRGQKRAAEPVILGETIILDDSDSTPVSNSVIALDDLEEERTSYIKKPMIDDTDISTENDMVKVRVWWRYGSIHKFYLRKHQKLATIFSFFANMENVPQETVFLVVYDTIQLRPTDTPASMKISAVDMLEGGIMKQSSVSNTRAVPVTRPTAKSGLEFKLLLKNEKRPLLINIEKEGQMKLLMIKCSEQLEVPLDHLKFTFDGEELDCNATPSDLDLEGGECIDVNIIQ